MTTRLWTSMRALPWSLAVAALVAAAPAAAQNAAPDSTAKPAAAPSAWRASWLSDRIPLRVGDILTVVVDEQTAASEKVSNIATGTRSQHATLSAQASSTNQNVDLKTGMDNGSRDVGEANRQGDLTAVLTVTVTGLSPSGLATIQGSKQVTVDGRTQEISLKGTVRPEDVTPSNLVPSNRIADTVIAYKGKKIGPRTGIVGKILSLLWP